MAAKKQTKPLPTIHDSLKDYTDKVTASAFKRGQLTERVRIAEWVVQRMETTKSAAERNLLQKIFGMLDSADD